MTQIATKNSYEKTESTAILQGDRLLPVEAIAIRWRVHPRTVLRYVRRGLLKAVRLPGTLRFRLADVLEFEKERWG